MIENLIKFMDFCLNNIGYIGEIVYNTIEVGNVFRREKNINTNL